MHQARGYSRWESRRPLKRQDKVQGRRRLDDVNDFVRVEIEAALARSIRVIPVLVEGARMPRADQLPVSLAAGEHHRPDVRVMRNQKGYVTG